MELSSVSRQPLQPQSHFFMTAISRKLRVNFAQLRALCATSPSFSSSSSSSSLQSHVPEIPIKRSVRIGSKVSDAQLKENWLASLSCPFLLANGDFNGAIGEINAGSECVLGIDPDTSGALALLKTDEHGCSAQVYDSPHLQVLVGKRIRKRLDAKEIVQLLQRFEARIGTKAYIEQSTPFPQDGKQGWWTGGFGYGLWIGILVALGFTVILVPSLTWKNNFAVSGKSSTKDDSRRVASILFPSLNPMLKRKKDHGRAEALLIAAYGKGLKIDPMLVNSSSPGN